ncbi:recombinase family protein [Tenacibaculum halocynthiae]|uniref:recombinase family protein n=1 Tax=Tenacibaculum halocynthiae TaxID=1254437 RepID=UPI003895312F
MSLDYFKKFSTYKEEVETNKNVWLYTRVSSKEQFEKNSSITNQKDSAEKYSKKHGYEITKVFGGTYESAKGDFTRKEFKKLYDEITKTKNKPFAVLIYKMSRFSRSGANAIKLVDEIIKKHGVHLIEVSTEKDSTTARGEFEIMESLQYARKENLERLEITLPGMTAFVKQGNWLGKSPRGYTTYGSRVTKSEHIASKQKIIINEEGELLKKAWKWKLKGEQDFIIKQKLEKLGLKISKQSLSAMWRKPFYAGISTHSFLNGEAIKGRWKGMVTPSQFKQINDKLEGNTSGYKQSKYSEERPLTHSLFCGNCGSKLTGYMAKGKYPYYKCQNNKCSAKDMNAKTTPRSVKKGVNDLFSQYLKKFELDPKLEDAFKEQLKLTFKELDKEQTENYKIISNQISEVKKKIETIDKKHIFDGLSDDLYNRYKTPLEERLTELNEELQNINLKISNQDKKIEDCVEVVKNISKYWASGNVNTKKRIQKLVFPEGVVINPENRQYRTKKTNAIFYKKTVIPRDSEWKIKNPSTKYGDGSWLVAGTGLEPVTFGL